jgi:hypothetical protein
MRRSIKRAAVGRAATLRVKDLRSITVKILPNKKRVQFRFETAGGSCKPIEVELASILALGLASETIKLLSPGRIPAKRAAAGARRKPRAAK